MSNHLGQIYSTTKNAEKYIVLNSQNVELSGNVKLTNGNLEISNNLTFNNFSVTDKINFRENSGSTSYNIINNSLTSINDASLNNVDICGNLKVNGQTQNSKVFMQMNALTQTGSGTESTITSWNTTGMISNPANLYQSPINIFNPHRNGFYSINFQTSLKATTGNATNAIIRLYQTVWNEPEEIVCQAQEQEANEQTMTTKFRFLNINIILFLTTTDKLRITIQGDGSYEMPASPDTNLSIHNVD